jgi:hypothetical protein
MAAYALSNSNLLLKALLSIGCCSMTVWFRRGGWKGGGELYKSKMVEWDFTKLLDPWMLAGETFLVRGNYLGTNIL